MNNLGKKCKERLFAVLLFVSFLLNINQCSKSDDSSVDKEMLEYELYEIKSELSLVKTEIEEIINILEQKKEKVEPVTMVKKQKVVKPVIIDSVMAEPILIENVDSLK